MNSAAENLSSVFFTEDHHGGEIEPPSPQVKSKHVSKRSRDLPYPPWMVDHEFEAHNRDLIVRLAHVESSISVRSRTRHQLSPIARLPSELLAQIFLCAVRAAPPKGTMLSQLVLSSVCSAWRAVALFTPEYWTIIYVSPEMPVSTYEMFISRSAPFPLSIEFFGWLPFKRKQYPRSNVPILERLLATLEPETHRLRSVTIRTATCSWTVCSLIYAWMRKFLYDSP